MLTISNVSHKGDASFNISESSSYPEMWTRKTIRMQHLIKDFTLYIITTATIKKTVLLAYKLLFAIIVFSLTFISCFIQSEIHEGHD